MDKDEFLFTDIALQMFTSFVNSRKNSVEENKEILSTFFSSLVDEYGDNPFFMPSLIYAFMTHINILFFEIAALNDVDESEVMARYAQHYNENVREDLGKSISNRPSMYKELMAIMDLDEKINNEGD